MQIAFMDELPGPLMRDVYGRGKYATSQHRHFETSRATSRVPRSDGTDADSWRQIQRQLRVST